MSETKKKILKLAMTCIVSFVLGLCSMFGVNVLTGCHSSGSVEWKTSVTREDVVRALSEEHDLLLDELKSVSSFDEAADIIKASSSRVKDKLVSFNLSDDVLAVVDEEYSFYSNIYKDVLFDDNINILDVVESEYLVSISEINEIFNRGSGGLK